MSRPIKILTAALAALVLVVALGFGLLFLLSNGRPVDFIQRTIIRLQLGGRQDDLNRSVSDDDTPVRFTVNLGDTPRLIAQNLVTANLITDAELFVDYVRLNELDRQLQAGTYFLNRAQTLTQIANALTDSRFSQIVFGYPEGFRIEEIAARIDSESFRPYFSFTGAEFLAVVGPGAQVDPAFVQQVSLPSGASLEGFLYPDTYQLPAEVTPTMLRDILLQTFQEKVGAQIPQDAAAQGLSLYEVVTLASIVQREAVHADEQPMIAGVYRNRLRLGMRLEADPTVQYGMGLTNGSWWPRITAADYSGVISPYNTYRNAGLPPGPIANPGVTAIRAVVYPTESDYLYFRADCRNDGYHDFARTFEEHLANGC